MPFIHKTIGSNNYFTLIENKFQVFKENLTRNHRSKAITQSQTGVDGLAVKVGQGPYKNMHNALVSCVKFQDSWTYIFTFGFPVEHVESS